MYNLSDYWGTQGGFFLETKPQTKKSNGKSKYLTQKLLNM